MARGKRSRVYWRTRGGEARAYGDFRDYRDVGGRQEPLIARGERRATTDPDVAAVVAASRLTELEGLRRGGGVTGQAAQAPATLGPFAEEYQRAKAASARVTGRWLDQLGPKLDAAVAFFGAGRPLVDIKPRDIRQWVLFLRQQPTRRQRPPADGTLRHYLHALSNLYRFAIAEDRVPLGFNPVTHMDRDSKPTTRRVEAKWLELPEAAQLLEAARLYRPKRADLAVPFLYPLLATMLLTGGRRAEVFGLESGDISFDRRTVTFRANQFRRLKNQTSFRSVPLWPQLEAILRSYVFEADRPPGRLLFPRYVAGREQLLTDLRKPLAALCEALGWPKGSVTPKMFRHTYCAARLQTLDGGAPVTPYTVGRELGHGADDMVRRVYGHLGQVRARGEVVEYRVVTTDVTTAPATPAVEPAKLFPDKR